MHPEQEQKGEDFGFGRVLSGERKGRLLNRDGTFNVQRSKRRPLRDRFSYVYLLQLSWPQFLAVVVVIAVLSNLLFAFAYQLCMPHPFAAGRGALFLHQLWRSSSMGLLNFSSTAPTKGSAGTTAGAWAADLIGAVESLFRLLEYVLITGLFFSRFARPVTRLRFSHHATVRSWDQPPSLLIRLMNRSHSEVIQLEASMVFTYRAPEVPMGRRYFPLDLERSRISFLPLSWTLVHRISEDSPLYGFDPKRFREVYGEILLQVSGIDEVSSQTIHARASYAAEELAWDAEFAEMYVKHGPENLLGIDMERFDKIVTRTEKAGA